MKDFSQKVTIFKIEQTNRAVLDAAKIVDVLMLVVPPTGVDEEGEMYISLLRSQGFPSSFVVLQNLDSLGKKKTDRKRELTKWAQTEIPRDPKVVTYDGENDTRQICRWINDQQARPITWREKRPYLLVDKYEFQPKVYPQEAQQNDQLSSLIAQKDVLGTLVVYGYLRGKSITANQLFHLVNFGTFQVDKISTEEAPTRNKRDTDAFVKSEFFPDQDQESLQASLIPDTINNEQTWPTKEDLEVATKSMKVPKGFSTYQASWIAEGDEKVTSDDDEDDDEDDLDSEMMNQDEEDDVDSIEDEDERNFDFGERSETQTQVDKHFNIDADEKMTDEERRAERERLIRAREEEDDDARFPDEVDTPADTPARIQFAKYRGLKSFRTSPWDPKENLPIDYARIFQFENFDRSAKLAMQEDDSDKCIDSDQYISIHLSMVPGERVMKIHQENKDQLVVFGLLRHEQKYSVNHFMIKKNPLYTEPIKSKDELIAQVGYRTFKCNPVFSEHNPRNDKHRFERFLQPSRFLAATIFAPITYRPAPVLLFKRNVDTGKLDLVAYGGVLAINPDRVMVKKIILTGYPFKVHKKQAVVRFMFHNAEDIKWFQPVELHTKYGRHGLITQSLGTHGYMKCVFDDTVHGHDTVCMSLYKRVFPKWSTETFSLLANNEETHQAMVDDE